MKLSEIKDLTFDADLSSLLSQIMVIRAETEVILDYLTKDTTNEEKQRLHEEIESKAAEHFKTLYDMYKDKDRKQSTFVEPRI